MRILPFRNYCVDNSERVLQKQQKLYKKVSQYSR